MGRNGNYYGDSDQEILYLVGACKRMKTRLTVDAIIYHKATNSIALVKRKYPPFEGQWVLPGGHVEKGESVRDAIIREVTEECSLPIQPIKILGVYNALGRDPRGYYISVVFVAKPLATRVTGGDDAAEALWFPVDTILKMKLGFDHSKMIADYLSQRMMEAAFLL
jgi:8-oxo-dGTP diphosphatase